MCDARMQRVLAHTWSKPKIFQDIVYRISASAFSRQELDKGLPRDAAPLNSLSPGPTAHADVAAPRRGTARGGGTWLQHFHSTQAEHSHSSTKGKCSNSSAFSPLLLWRNFFRWMKDIQLSP